MVKHAYLMSAVLLAVGAPVAAQAQSAMPVVQVHGCVASAGAPAQTFTSPFGQQVAQPSLPPMLMIDFANASSNPIATVDFGLVSNGKVVAMVRDVGMFAPNATVMHAYGIQASQVPGSGSAATCIPLSVKYADGTTWMNPNMPGH
jgi:hypothetical protein